MVLFCTKILVLICFKNVNGVFMNDALKKKNTHLDTGDLLYTVTNNPVN